MVVQKIAAFSHGSTGGNPGAAANPSATPLAGSTRAAQAAASRSASQSASKIAASKVAASKAKARSSAATSSAGASVAGTSASNGTPILNAEPTGDAKHSSGSYVPELVAGVILIGLVGFTGVRYWRRKQVSQQS